MLQIFGDNNAIVSGCVGKNATYKMVGKNNDIPRASFSVSADKRKTKDGEYETVWVYVNAWRNLGQTLGRYISKGQTVFVTGKFETFKSNDGKVYESISADAIFVMGNPAAAQAVEDDYPVPNEAPHLPPGAMQEIDDDLPF